MRVAAHERGRFRADGAVAESGALGAAGDDSDVFGHGFEIRWVVAGIEFRRQRGRGLGASSGSLLENSILHPRRHAAGPGFVQPRTRRR